jgi:hypothetical protein
MGEFGSGERWGDNPFVYFEASEYLVQPQQKQEMPNPLRAMYEDIAPLLLRSPPSKRYPQQPTGRKSWDILTDPLSELVFTSAVPDPIIGETLQTFMRPTVEGKEGLATHLNILVDCSTSMGSGSQWTCYGVTPLGMPLYGYHLAQICSAMMVAQAELAKDSFSIWGFASGASRVWPDRSGMPPSQNHKGALDFLLDLAPENNAPFTPSGGTNLAKGLDLVGQDLQSYDFDKCVTVVILDGAWGSVEVADGQLFSPEGYNDHDLRKRGPVFYVTIGSPSNEEQVKDSTQYMREALTNYYGQEMNGCCLTFILHGADSGSSIMNFGGELVQMAQINAGIPTDIRDGDGKPLKPCPQI